MRKWETLSTACQHCQPLTGGNLLAPAAVAANSAELFLNPSEWDCWWAEGGDVTSA